MDTKTAYIIRVRPLRWRGMIYHEALVLPDLVTGEMWALDITQHSVNPQRMPLDTFLAMGDPIISIRELPGLDIANAWTAFAVLQPKRRYNVLTYNCDHFIDEIRFFRPRSEQLSRKLAIGSALLLIAAVLIALLIK